MFLTWFISAPLLSNILPHLQTLVNFIANTLPKPVLVALLYRLAILQFASRILPTIGADAWEIGPSDGWDGRPVIGICVLDTCNPHSPCSVDLHHDSHTAHVPPANFRHGVFALVA